MSSMQGTSKSAVFRYLRKKIGGKPISHKEPRSWVPVCGVVNRTRGAGLAVFLVAILVT